MNKKRMLEDSNKYFVLAIDHYNGGELSGKIYHASRDVLVVFSSFTQMALIVEEILRKLHYPMRTMKQRQFAITSYQDGIRAIDSEGESCKDLSSVKGKLATARLSIKHRDSLTWQGELDWMEEGKVETFKSFLQLMLILDQKFGGEAVSGISPCISHVFRIVVKNYDYDSMKGCIERIPFGVWYGFQSVMELMKLIHYSMERGDVHIGSEINVGDIQRPEHTSFIVRILFSENLTWQGSLRLDKTGESVHFRSFLEMLFLMDATLSE